MKLYLFLLLTNVFAFSTAKPTLELVLLLFRHGDRSPVNTYPGYPHMSAWPQGFGQLTTLGMQEQYQLGTFLKQRYIPSYLSSAYRRNETYVRSTDSDRTIMSALAQLSAIFPPSGDQVFEQSLAWQPVPVHSVPAEYDSILRSYKANCPAYAAKVDEFMKSEEYVEMGKKYQYLFDEITRATGSQVNLTNVWMFFDVQFCDRMHNLSLPEWAKNNSQTLAQLNNYDMKVKFALKDIKPYMAGRILWYFWDLVNAKMNKSVGTKVYWLSAHDVTLVSFLSALQVWNGLQPPYASLVISELMRDDDRWYFNFYFKNSSGEPLLLSVPGCESTNCSVDKLKDLTKNITLSQDEWENACGMRDTPTFDLRVLPYIIALGILSFLIVFLCFVWLLTIRCRRIRKPKYNLLQAET